MNKKLIIAEILAFLLVLILSVFIWNNKLIFDEIYHYHNVKLLKYYGFNSEFIYNLYGLPGPLFSTILFIFDYIGNGNIGILRLTNFALIIITFIYLIKTSNLIYSPLKVTSISVGLLSIPMTLTCMSMTLTEISALTMVIISVYYLFKSNGTVNIYLIISAFFYSLSISGRQIYIFLLIPFLFYLIRKNNIKKMIIPIIIFHIISAIIPLYMFLIWGDILPPKNIGTILSDKNLININGLLLGLGYTFLIFLLIDYKSFLRIIKLNTFKIIIFLIIGFTLTVLFSTNNIPLSSAIINIIPSTLLNKAIFSANWLISTCSVISIYLFIYYIKENNSSNEKLFLIIALSIILFSIAKIGHQFSTRYVFQASIFIVLLFAPTNINRFQFVLRLLGLFLGIISVLSYYLVHN